MREDAVLDRAHLCVYSRAEERVRHLQGERWDYKGWHYDSASAAWVDYARYQAEWYRDKYGALILLLATAFMFILSCREARPLLVLSSRIELGAFVSRLAGCPTGCKIVYNACR